MRGDAPEFVPHANRDPSGHIILTGDAHAFAPRRKSEPAIDLAKHMDQAAHALPEEVLIVSSVDTLSKRPTPDDEVLSLHRTLTEGSSTSIEEWRRLIPAEDRIRVLGRACQPHGKRDSCANALDFEKIFNAPSTASTLYRPTEANPFDIETWTTEPPRRTILTHVSRRFTEAAIGHWLTTLRLSGFSIESRMPLNSCVIVAWDTTEQASEAISKISHTQHWLSAGKHPVGITLLRS